MESTGETIELTAMYLYDSEKTNEQSHSTRRVSNVKRGIQHKQTNKQKYGHESQ